MSLNDSPLGKPSPYPNQLDAALLCAIPRAPMRERLGLVAAMPFIGADFWTAYELSWLNPKGKPQVALAYLTVPAETPFLIESKSLKLYLNSLNQAVFEDEAALKARLVADLSAAAWWGAASNLERPLGAQVGVLIKGPGAWDTERLANLAGTSLDRLDIAVDRFEPCPACLRVDATQAPVQETLVSDLLKSNCMVTGQPDWASVQIAYTGAPIDHEGLLRYLLGFRLHQAFHEPCVEQIFADIWQRCQPLKLSVYARYTRRGGLDINPWRASHPQLPPPRVRTGRQ